MEQTSGLAAVHFVDDNCTSILGQPHDRDTAHDLTWGWSSLEPGRKIDARAALWITVLNGTHEQRMQQVIEKDEQLRTSWAK